MLIIYRIHISKHSMRQNLNYSNKEDHYISFKEINNAVKKLSTGKACGEDMIINEMLKVGIDSLLPAIVKLFNIIKSYNLVFFQIQNTGILCPIYKKR
jgi:hypothetical protein